MKHILTSVLGVVGAGIAAAFGGWSESTATSTRRAMGTTSRTVTSIFLRSLTFAFA